jgi:hypothetical protein
MRGSAFIYRVKGSALKPEVVSERAKPLEKQNSHKANPTGNDGRNQFNYLIMLETPYADGVAQAVVREVLGLNAKPEDWELVVETAEFVGYAQGDILVSRNEVFELKKQLLDEKPNG